MLGEAMVYPTNTGANQVAGEKELPIDYSIFNIGGHVFGARGAKPTPEEATIFNVRLDRTIGTRNPIKLRTPIMLPALIKLDWQDYFAAAAMAGTICVIGEGSPGKDPALELDENGRITKFEKLNEMLDSFRAYYRGYGQIVLQCNLEDIAMGLPEYAIQKCGAEAIEFKFGQSAKGTQPANRLKNIDEALKKKKAGLLVYPDPEDEAVAQAARDGFPPVFWTYARLPMWTLESISEKIEQLRRLGLKNVYFKMAGFAVEDMQEVLRIAAATEADLVTFDGAGGGSGYSPTKMMNEWGYPALCIESAIVSGCRELEQSGKRPPDIAITGGFSTEDQAYKALAFGAPYVKLVGMARATMAAAMAGKKLGALAVEGKLPKNLEKFGSTVDELFIHLPELRGIYRNLQQGVSTGAAGAYSFLRKTNFGMRHFAALNRKFDIRLADRGDLIPLTSDAQLLLEDRWFER